MAPNNNKENFKTGSLGKRKRTSRVQASKKESSKAFEDSISKSKQLIQKCKVTRAPRTSRKGSKKEPEPRLCGNGKPMPSLAELEKMFDDDSDEDIHKPTVTEPSRCKTPDQPIIIDDPTSLTPNTIEKISNKMMEYITNLTDEAPPLPVVPQRRRKRKNPNPPPNNVVEVSESKATCTTKKSKVCVGKSHETYGVNYSLLHLQELEDIPPEKSDYRTLSHSIFNPKSAEIAEMLNENDHNKDKLSDASEDSDQTVAYEFTHSPTFMSRSFSPLPSTSTDTETIMKNEALLNESLKSIKLNRSTSPQEKIGKDYSDVIVIPSNTFETVIIDDELADIEKIYTNNENCDTKEVKTRTEPLSTTTTIKDDSDVIVIPSNTCETVIIDDELPDIEKNNSNEANTDKEVKTRTQSQATTTMIEDDPYSTIVIDDDYPQYDKDECEIFDIDEVIASNNNFISKYKDDAVTITHIRPNIIQSDDDSVSFPGPSSSPIVSHSRPNNSNPPRQRRTRKNKNNFPQDFTPATPTTPVRHHTVVLSSSTPISLISPAPLVPNSPAQARKIGECPICMDNLGSSSISSTICGHIFCTNCIKEAVRANGKKCPTCRKKLTGVGFHPLFL